MTLTRCPEPWSSLWIPAGRRGVGTTASPPQRRRSDWGWTWTEPDLYPEPDTEVQSVPTESEPSVKKI